MEATDDEDTYFYIHTLAAQNGGRLGLLAPERIVIDGQPKGRLLGSDQASLNQTHRS
jgi:hypothetical protein